MRKHIKVKAELSPDKKEVTITFLEQSHYVKEFGNLSVDAFCAGSAFNYGDVRLLSLDTGRPDAGGKDPIKVWLPISSAQLGQNTKTCSSQWPRIKAAIEAYNNTEF